MQMNKKGLPSQFMQDDTPKHAKDKGSTTAK